MTASTTGSTMKKGSRGAEVTALQGQLNQLGYGLDADGVFGDDTERCVKHLQKAFGYDVDGSVGDATQFLINQQIGLGWKAGH